MHQKNVGASLSVASSDEYQYRTKTLQNNLSKNPCLQLYSISQHSLATHQRNGFNSLDRLASRPSTDQGDFMKNSFFPKSLTKSLLSLGALLLIAGTFLHSSNSCAISEENYQTVYDSTILPFLKTGDPFTFKSADGKYDLSGVKFIHPNSKGTIVIITGRSEPWLKYGEVFFDLYAQGYSLYSMDHRGQGLSPHLSLLNPQIGHVDYFNEYTRDLKQFVDMIVVKQAPAGEKLYLIAHSMGGGIAADYLEQNASPFRAVVLNSPMARIFTKPYPEPIAKTIVAAECAMGRGSRYAIGEGDFDPATPYENNNTTRSPARFKMTNDIFALYPQTTIGGPSNRWVNQSMIAMKRIRNQASQIQAPLLVFQAEADQIVKTEDETHLCTSAKDCKLIAFPDSQHEILMERDSIRNPAMAAILAFFNAH